MNPILIILTLVFFSLSSFGQVYKTVVNDEDTAFVYPIRYYYEYDRELTRDSLPNGKWVAYYGGDDSGSIFFTGYYKSGKPNGLFQYYYKNGKVRYTCVYKDGIKDGPYTNWNEEGTIRAIGQKLEGKSDGVQYNWWGNGILRRYSIWKNDTLNGIERSYYKDGSLETIGNYSKGHQIGEWLIYHKNSKLKLQLYFVDSLSKKELDTILKYKNTYAYPYFPVGIWKGWDEKGNLTYEGIYDDNHEKNKGIKYYPSGIKKTETNYKGFHQGKENLEGCRGDIMSDRDTSYPIENGLFQEWYENGHLKIKGVWKNHKKEGEWTYWLSSGKVQRIEVYKDDILIKEKIKSRQKEK